MYRIKKRITTLILFALFVLVGYAYAAAPTTCERQKFCYNQQGQITNELYCKSTSGQCESGIGWIKCDGETYTCPGS